MTICWSASGYWLLTEFITSSKSLSGRTSERIRRYWHRGSIATYATNVPTPEIPFWQLVFVNAKIFFVGSDDVPVEAKIEATRDINQALEAGWQGLDIGKKFALDDIAQAHEPVEHPLKEGRVIVTI